MCQVNILYLIYYVNLLIVLVSSVSIEEDSTLLSHNSIQIFLRNIFYFGIKCHKTARLLFNNAKLREYRELFHHD